MRKKIKATPAFTTKTLAQAVGNRAPVGGKRVLATDEVTYKRGKCSDSDFTPGEGVVLTHRGTALPQGVACDRDVFVGICVRTDAKRRTVTVKAVAR